MYIIILIVFTAYLLFFVLPVGAAIPQKTIFELGYTQTSNAGLEQASGSGEFKVKEIYLNGKFARQETELGSIIYGVDYNQHRFMLANGYNSHTLHQLALPVTLVNRRQHWTLVGQIAPGLNSDFESLDDDDFTTTALLSAAYHASVNTTWVMGAAVDRSFGDSQIYPLLGVNYLPNSSWQFQIILPRPVVKYTPNPATIIYWQAQPVGNKWNVEPSGIDQSFNVTTRAIRSGIGLELDINHEWWFKAEVGREFNRELETITNNGTELDLEANDANYFLASFIYRM